MFESRRSYLEIPSESLGKRVPSIKLATNAAPTTPSVDISDLVSSAVINQIVDELEITAMGDTAHRYVAGLQSGTFTIDFINDWASSQVMQTLNAAFGQKTVFYFCHLSWI